MPIKIAKYMQIYISYVPLKTTKKTNCVTGSWDITAIDMTM